jgi:hypothetical protein
VTLWLENVATPANVGGSLGVPWWIG